jgi:hypothetical protein
MRHGLMALLEGHEEHDEHEEELWTWLLSAPRALPGRRRLRVKSTGLEP